MNDLSPTFERDLREGVGVVSELPPFTAVNPRVRGLLEPLGGNRRSRGEVERGVHLAAIEARAAVPGKRDPREEEGAAPYLD